MKFAAIISSNDVMSCANTIFFIEITSELILLNLTSFACLTANVSPFKCHLPFHLRLLIQPIRSHRHHLISSPTSNCQRLLLEISFSYYPIPTSDAKCERASFYLVFLVCAHECRLCKMQPKNIYIKIYILSAKMLTLIFWRTCGDSHVECVARISHTHRCRHKVSVVGDPLYLSI